MNHVWAPLFQYTYNVRGIAGDTLLLNGLNSATILNRGGFEKGLVLDSKSHFSINNPDAKSKDICDFWDWDFFLS